MSDTSISIANILPPSGFSFQMLITTQLEQPFISYDPTEYAGPEGFSIKKKYENIPYITTHSLLDTNISAQPYVPQNIQHKATFSRFRKKGVHNPEVAARIEANRIRREEERAAKIEERKLDAELRLRHKLELAEIKRKAKLSRNAANKINAQKRKLTEQVWYQERLKKLREESKQRREQKALAAEIRKQEKVNWQEEANANRKERVLAAAKSRNKSGIKHGDYDRFPATYDGYKQLYTHYNAMKKKCDPVLVTKMLERIAYIRHNAPDIEIINGKVYSKNHQMGGRSNRNPNGSFLQRNRSNTTATAISPARTSDSVY